MTVLIAFRSETQRTIASKQTKNIFYLRHVHSLYNECQDQHDNAYCNQLEYLKDAQASNQGFMQLREPIDAGFVQALESTLEKFSAESAETGTCKTEDTCKEDGSNININSDDITFFKQQFKTCIANNVVDFQENFG